MHGAPNEKQSPNGSMNIAKAIKTKPIKPSIGLVFLRFYLPSLGFLLILVLCLRHYFWFLHLFYARLDIVLAVAMTALIAVMAWIIYLLPVGVGFYIGVFILAWIGQFYGHKVEGKKPSFFKDLQFLLIGPVWCMDAYLGKVLPKWKTRQKLAF
jgi:uncharacterized membrane protein YGL010W